MKKIPFVELPLFSLAKHRLNNSSSLCHPSIQNILMEKKDFSCLKYFYGKKKGLYLFLCIWFPSIKSNPKQKLGTDLQGWLSNLCIEINTSDQNIIPVQLNYTPVYVCIPSSSCNRHTLPTSAYYDGKF